ncbi:hypothetical protein HID58_068187 [Brassica napus]|uniref:Uncharacterized protein n=1 Tax=Brassica napus TaxID=3708 RepID=A0ABQ7ZL67_BRANA|nr:hypothetical protein HID58_068187 [Brassica napus]
MLKEKLIRVHIDRSADRCCPTDSKSFVLTGKGHLKYFYNPILSGTLSVALLWDPCNRPTAAEALYVPFFQIQPQVWPEIVPLKRGYQWDKVL